jgi:hypothetical protein
MPDHPGWAINQNEALIVLTVIDAHSIPQNEDAADVCRLLWLSVLIANLGHVWGDCL